MAYFWALVILSVLKLSKCQENLEYDVMREQDVIADDGEVGEDETEGNNNGENEEIERNNVGEYGETEGNNAGENETEDRETKYEDTNSGPKFGDDYNREKGTKDIEEIAEIPFSKSKVKYHKSRICIQIGDAKHCVVNNESPGDSKKVAKFIRVYSSMVKPKVHSIQGKNKNRKLRPFFYQS